MGLPVGQHITFKAKDDSGKDFFRPYTPTTDDDTPGHVDFVIKVYPGGKMSQHLEHLKIGHSMLFKGPKGRYTYEKGSLDAIGRSYQQLFCIVIDAWVPQQVSNLCSMFDFMHV